MPIAAQTSVSWQKPAAAAMLPLLLVFLCGVTVGALAMSIGIHRSPRPASAWTENGKPITLAHWKQELDLNDEQTRQLETILDDFSKYYDNVLADGNTRILQILDEKQKAKFERIMRERR